ncbi:hypothetical protein [Nostoc sp. CHAB 5715]|uniref:hypothetical protein n=1 Tax=Nostoc sp. CHAB 5715 TaxID=2780400 RepID=UPI001E50C31C|nr:hypothetical protein [Nostoc sp. CHAB 5715]MCC5623481.1 hypothetical protein [Nostoc sp. CHAB 5715]
MVTPRFLLSRCGIADASAQKPQVPKLTVLKIGHQKGMALLNIVKAQGSLEKIQFFNYELRLM